MIKKRFPPENLSLRKYFLDLINQFMKPASNGVGILHERLCILHELYS